jgi:hypothetical protein
LRQLRQWVTICVRHDCNAPGNRRLGYARFSTFGRTFDAQLEQLHGTGCARILPRGDERHGDRREPPKMLAALDPGDVVKMIQSWASRAVPSTCFVAGRLVFSQDEETGRLASLTGSDF